MKKNKKTIAVGIAAVLLIGAGSAAVINHFVLATGSGEVNDAVAVSPSNPTVSFSGESAPETYQKEIALTNNNEDEAIDYTWQVDEGGDAVTSDDPTYINTGVYEVQKYALEQGGDEGSTVIDETLYVESTPSIDTVTYRAELPTDYFDRNDVANAGFQISPENSEADDSPVNYQVIYYPDRAEGDWKFTTPSLSQDTTVNGKENVEARDEVVSVDYTDNSESPDVVEVTVQKPGDEQSFGFQATDGGEGYDAFHTEDFYDDGGFSDQGTASHQTVEGSLVGQEVALSGSASQTYNFVTEFTEQTGSGSYEVTAKAVP